jgi:hypothetical protein
MKNIDRAEREVSGKHKNQNIFDGDLWCTMLRESEFGKLICVNSKQVCAA